MNRAIKGTGLLIAGAIMLAINMAAMQHWGFNPNNTYIKVTFFAFIINTIWGYVCLFMAGNEK